MTDSMLNPQQFPNYPPKPVRLPPTSTTSHAAMINHTQVESSRVPGQPRKP